MKHLEYELRQIDARQEEGFMKGCKGIAEYKMDIQEIKKNIIQYNLHEVVDSVPYGNYSVSIFNEGNKILIAADDYEGLATWAMDREDFLSIATNEELERLIDSVIYYNYIERKEECDCE